MGVTVVGYFVQSVNYLCILDSQFHCAPLLIVVVCCYELSMRKIQNLTNTRSKILEKKMDENWKKLEQNEISHTHHSDSARV